MAACSTPNLEELHAELLYLVTRYSCEPQVTLATAIKDQLQRILRHPLMEIFPEFRKQCVVSLSIWRKRASFQALPDRSGLAVLH